jgi:hypothetical protein
MDRRLVAPTIPPASEEEVSAVMEMGKAKGKGKQKALKGPKAEMKEEKFWKLLTEGVVGNYPDLSEGFGMRTPESGGASVNGEAAASGGDRGDRSEDVLKSSTSRAQSTGQSLHRRPGHPRVSGSAHAPTPRKMQVRPIGSTASRNPQDVLSGTGGPRQTANGNETREQSIQEGESPRLAEEAEAEVHDKELDGMQLASKPD